MSAEGAHQRPAITKPGMCLLQIGPREPLYSTLVLERATAQVE